MPAGTLPPIAGDPLAVNEAARTFEATAKCVAETSSRLRSLTGTSWRGPASVRASVRTATLPQKLDKVVTSYASAGAALRGYASSLAETQARSAAAIRAAATAQAEVARLRVEQAAAPPDASPRYDASISEAETRFSRAVASNEAAREDQRRAASAATRRLHEASAKGVKNQPWWRHVVTSAARFASLTWTSSLRVVARVATSISALAGLAALAMSIAGLVFPPLVGAAAVLETISLVSAVMATCADASLAAAGRGSWKSVAVDAVALAPWAGSKLVGKAARLLSNPTRVAANTVPRAEGATASYPVVLEKGAKTRSINFRPTTADPNWGLRRGHVRKHIFGPGPSPLVELDPAGTTDRWRDLIQELASRPTTARRAGGIEEIVGVFAKADGSGTFKLGIRLSRVADGSFDLVTLLTRQ
ncbi:MAG TPA: hypothetical protein VF218_16330 [Acidothermaceae bacterium]